MTGITSNNTDSSSIQYTILSQSGNSIAQLLTPPAPSRQVTQIDINNAGSFTLQALSPETQNFNSSSAHFYVTIPQITPVISFLTKLPNSWVYGNNPYTFTPATIINNDPSQIITYSITTISCPNPPIGSFANNKIPSITINSVGTFQVNATCLASADKNYTAPSQLCISRTISVGAKVPIITFSNSLINSITYAYNLNYPLPQPIAIVNNSVQTQSLFSYSAVKIDSNILSPVASISSNNASLIVNSVGNFRIYAQVSNSINHDFSANEAYYNITITQATPTITSTLAIPSSWIYGNSYNIPYPTTSNTDPNIVFSYSIINKDNLNIASVPVSGTTVKIIGVGKFQISVTISPTTNYKQATYIYPSPSTYYTSIKATPVITFNVDKSATYDTSYNLVPVQFVTGDPLTQKVTYSIK